MSIPSALLIDLAGVARLAGVRRAVASVWRSRFAAGSDAFPQAVSEKDGAVRFDAQEVAEWLVRTGHGNNADALADAAASAAPPGFSFTEACSVAELEALIALIAHVDDMDGMTLEEAASRLDPHDNMLLAEVAAHARRGEPWVEYATQLVDAAYSPSSALTLVARRHAASLRSTGSAGQLVDGAIALVVDLTLALVREGDSVRLEASDVSLASRIAGELGDDVGIVLPDEDHGRRVRRRLLVDGGWLAERGEAAPRLVAVARVPYRPGEHVAAILQTVDEVSLSLRASDVAVIIGPARALVDPLGPANEQVRADIIRSGRVRGMARLPAGLVDSAVRESLALWVFGPRVDDESLADRVTAVADLTAVQLTAAARADLVSDLAAALHGGRDLRDHQFRFASFARTSSLQARSGSLVAPQAAEQVRVDPDVSELPALIDLAADGVRPDILPVEFLPAQHDVPRAASVPALIKARHLRKIQGVRVDPDLIGTEGLIVVTQWDLDDPVSIGRSRVDQLDFATRNPNAQLTRPGDVIFRTSPSAAAWVDVDGSKVVVAPARVLRISESDPGGLVAEVIAADITGATAGPGAWKRWMLRRVAPQAINPLRQALTDIATARKELETRAARLSDYAALIVAGATSGAVTVIDTIHAADTATTR
ncbi:hypothetical protein QP735_01945 [Curtobacterium citreum]|uniref:hypothetical protein n=1 Tax=Curtobacterium citreum TaxID=2036 RepID=UPI00255131E7|nr:hypothetical protein [Curtobacterium citreum]MDK8171279.1 hypothetical protein [Curtobacterium citreum]